MLPGATMVVLIETVIQVADEVSPQVLDAVTQSVPPVVVAFTTRLVVPCPETMAHPAGTLQV
jgi:hypothetical protein